MYEGGPLMVESSDVNRGRDAGCAVGATLHHRLIKEWMTGVIKPRKRLGKCFMASRINAVSYCHAE